MVESVHGFTEVSARQVPESMMDGILSVVIPVFNSAGIVGTTIDRTVAFFRRLALRFEVLCVNDGSDDASWEVLEEGCSTPRWPRSTCCVTTDNTTPCCAGCVVPVAIGW